MEDVKGHPKTLPEAISYSSNLDTATRFVVNLRWPDGVQSRHCGPKEKHSYIPTRRKFMCKCCCKQFSGTAGTMFQHSPLGLDKWLTAIWMIPNAKNAVSSMEIHPSIGVTQDTAWFMLHRMRLAVQTGAFAKFPGQVETGETFIASRARSMTLDPIVSRRI